MLLAEALETRAAEWPAGAAWPETRVTPFESFSSSSTTTGVAVAVDCTWGNFACAYEFAAGESFSRDRYLDPSTGRWLQPDRTGLSDGPNQYLYARGMPTLAADPFGDRTLILYGDPGPFDIKAGSKTTFRWTLNFATRPSYERALKLSFLSQSGESSTADIDTMEISHQADLVEVSTRETYYETVIYFGHAWLSDPVLSVGPSLELNAKEFAFLMYGQNSKKRMTPKNLILAGCNTAQSGFVSGVRQLLPLTNVIGYGGYLNVGVTFSSAPPYDVLDVFTSGTKTP